MDDIIFTNKPSSFLEVIWFQNFESNSCFRGMRADLFFSLKSNTKGNNSTTISFIQIYEKLILLFRHFPDFRNLVIYVESMFPCHSLLNIKVIERRTLRSVDIFGNWKHFKNGEKYFLFHLKSLFRSLDI